MNFPFKKQIPQNYPTQRVKEKSCRRIIKRDENGRIKEERLEGDCSKVQLEAFRRGNRLEDENDL